MKRKTKNKRAEHPKVKAVGELGKALDPEAKTFAGIGRAPSTHGGHESLRGFKEPRRKWVSIGSVCRRCQGQGSYLEKGILRMCNHR